MTPWERLTRQVTQVVTPSSSLIVVPPPTYTPDPAALARLLSNQVLDPGTSLGFPLASPLGFEPATILFNYQTAPVSDSLYNAPMLRLSAGVPFQEGSFVVDLVFPRGKPNWGASYMQVYTVTNGILT